MTHNAGLILSDPRRYQRYLDAVIELTNLATAAEMETARRARLARLRRAAR